MRDWVANQTQTPSLIQFIKIYWRDLILLHFSIRCFITETLYAVLFVCILSGIYFFHCLCLFCSGLSAFNKLYISVFLFLTVKSVGHCSVEAVWMVNVSSYLSRLVSEAEIVGLDYDWTPDKSKQTYAVNAHTYSKQRRLLWSSSLIQIFVFLRPSLKLTCCGHVEVAFTEFGLPLDTAMLTPVHAHNITNILSCVRPVLIHAELTFSTPSRSHFYTVSHVLEQIKTCYLIIT